MSIRTPASVRRAYSRRDARPDPPADMPPSRTLMRHSAADSIVPIFIAALLSQRQRPYWGITHQREQRSESYIAQTFFVEEEL
jgi:hypothetical protein